MGGPISKRLRGTAVFGDGPGGSWAALRRPMLTPRSALSIVGEPGGGPDPAMAPSSAAWRKATMTPIEIDVRDYLDWMAIHNYARTTIECRSRHLGYFVCYAAEHGVAESRDVSLELLVSY